MASPYMRKLSELAAELGCELQHSKHMILRHPEGWVVTAPCTPRDERVALARVRSDVRYARVGAGRFSRPERR